MYKFTNKNIIILSPQEWDSQHLSKHHYATELALMGNKVLFIDIASKKNGFGASIRVPNPQLPNLMVANYQMPIPFSFSFYFSSLYKLINLLQVKRIIKKVFSEIDVCLDFGHYRMFDNLKVFNAQKKIFFPVDDFENLLPDLRGAQYCFSVSNVIVLKMNKGGLSCHFINHGLSRIFASKAELLLKESHNIHTNKVIKVGYSGNLMIPFLDRELFRCVVESNEKVEFHCFGNCSADKNNMQDQKWEEWLNKQDNIVLYGSLGTEALSTKMQEMSAFWLCYKPDNKNYHAENSHKILEYLSIGKTIITTPITLYKDSPLLYTFEQSNYVLGFTEVLENLAINNSTENKRARIEFALKNTYESQIKRIGNLISSN